MSDEVIVHLLLIILVGIITFGLVVLHEYMDFKGEFFDEGDDE